MKTCEYPGCHRTARFLNSWNNETDKHFGLVCATHDKELGRKNLMKYMSIEEAILFERYMHEVPDEVFYPDFPDWLKENSYVPQTTELPDLSSRTWNALKRRQYYYSRQTCSHKH